MCFIIPICNLKMVIMKKNNRSNNNIKNNINIAFIILHTQMNIMSVSQEFQSHNMRSIAILVRPYPFHNRGTSAP